MPRDRRRAAADLHPTLDDAEKARLFRHGAELFDGGRYFEAHEPWEEIWRSRNPEPRELFRGLVQVAAGFHHWFERGRAGPAARLLARGAGRLAPFADAPETAPASATIDLVGFVDQLARWRAWLVEHAGEPPPPPRLRPARER